MLRRCTLFVIAAVFAINIYGCVALIAGAAGGAGTAAWLSGKLTQQFNTPLDKTLQAAKSALKSLNLNINKETIEEKKAQIMSTYTNGKTVWIDIHRVSESVSRVDIRVGVTGDQNAARIILSRIVKYL